MNTLKFGNGEWYGKKDTILAYNDENSNFKPLPFSFDRASSATRVNKDGLIETVGSGEPRIDYKDDSKGALLLEPSRSNLITNSQSVINGWISSSIVTADNQAISPDGTFTSGHITSLGDSSYGSIRKAISVSANSTYTISLFVKKEVSETYYMGVGFVFSGGTTDVGYGIIDAVNGTGYSADPRIPFTIKVDDYETYWRFSFTGTDSGSNSSLNAYIYSTLSKNGTSTELGLGSTRTIWGMQVEQGSYATSYIPTSGSVVTRVADSCSQTVPSGVIGQTEGVLYCEVDVKSGYDTNNLMVTLSDGTNLKQIYINRSNGKLEFFVGTNINEMVYVAPSVLTNGVHKLALAYKQDDFAVAIDGVIAYTDNNGNVPTCNKINVGSHYNENLPFNDRINDVKLYNTRLSNSELQALTTL